MLMLDLLQQFLDFEGISWLRVDGQTPVAERQVLVRAAPLRNDCGCTV